MAGMGETSLKKSDASDRAIGQFFSKPPAKQQEQESFTIQKAVKLSPTQNQHFETLKLALGTDLDSEALRWCFDQIWALRGEEIEEIARKRKEFSLS